MLLILDIILKVFKNIILIFYLKNRHGEGINLTFRINLYLCF